jgi:hypothetical protein
MIQIEHKTIFVNNCMHYNMIFYEMHATPGIKYINIY